MTTLPNKITGLFFGLFLSFNLIASTPESCLLFSLTSQSTARLGIVNTSDRSLDLSIINLNGEVYFSKAVSGQQNYFQLLDLAKMPNGEYTVKLIGLNTECEKKFLITNATAQLLKEERETIPAFRLLDDETLTVSYINSRQNKVNILLERDNELVFEDRGLMDIALNKRYSLKKLPDGEYLVKLSSGEKTYRFPLVLK